MQPDYADKFSKTFSITFGSLQEKSFLKHLSLTFYAFHKADFIFPYETCSWKARLTPFKLGGFQRLG